MLSIKYSFCIISYSRDHLFCISRNSLIIYKGRFTYILPSANSRLTLVGRYDHPSTCCVAVEQSMVVLCAYVYPVCDCYAKSIQVVVYSKATI